MATHSFIGRRPLIGATDQAASPVEFSMTWKTVAGVVINAAASAIFSSGTLKHDAEIKRLKNAKGGRCTTIASDETLTLDVVAVPVGAVAANTLANALLTATLPGALGFCTIAGAPVFAYGPFTDALNSPDWCYEGGGSLEINSEGEWGLKFTVIRSANLATQNVVAL